MVGAPRAGGDTGSGFDLQFHQALGREGQHLAHEIRIGALLNQPENGHSVVSRSTEPLLAADRDHVLHKSSSFSVLTRISASIRVQDLRAIEERPNKEGAYLFAPPLDPAVPFTEGAAAIVFGFSFFGFLASRLPRCSPFGMSLVLLSSAAV